MNSLSVFRCRIVAVEGDDHFPQRRRRCDVVLDHGTDVALQFVDIDMSSLFQFAFDAASISLLFMINSIAAFDSAAGMPPIFVQSTNSVMPRRSRSSFDAPFS